MSLFAGDPTVASTGVKAGLNLPLQTLYSPALSSLGTSSVDLLSPSLSYQVGSADPTQTLTVLFVTVVIQGLHCWWFAMQSLHCSFSIGAL